MRKRIIRESDAQTETLQLCERVSYWDENQTYIEEELYKSVESGVYHLFSHKRATWQGNCSSQSRILTDEEAGTWLRSAHWKDHCGPEEAAIYCAPAESLREAVFALACSLATGENPEAALRRFRTAEDHIPQDSDMATRQGFRLAAAALVAFNVAADHE